MTPQKLNAETTQVFSTIQSILSGAVKLPPGTTPEKALLPLLANLYITGVKDGVARCSTRNSDGDILVLFDSKTQLRNDAFNSLNEEYHSCLNP